MSAPRITAPQLDCITGRMLGAHHFVTLMTRLAGSRDVGTRLRTTAGGDQHLGKRGLGHWACKDETLQRLALQLQYRVELLLRFNSFNHDTAPFEGRNPRQGFENKNLRRICFERGHQLPIDFYPVRPHCLQRND